MSFSDDHLMYTYCSFLFSIWLFLYNSRCTCRMIPLYEQKPKDWLNHDLNALFMRTINHTVSKAQTIKNDTLYTGYDLVHSVTHLHMYIIAEECLLSYKNWCIVLVTFLSIPLCLFCWAVNLDLAWTYYFTGILIASSVVPIALSIVCARATATGKSHMLKKRIYFCNILLNS